MFTRRYKDGICGNFLTALLEIFFVGGTLHWYALYRVNTFNLSLAKDKADTFSIKLLI